MQALDDIRGIDIYLLDAMMKEYIQPTSRILDAGCGGGRNMHFFLSKGYDIIGFDHNEEQIQDLQHAYPNRADRFVVASFSTFTSSNSFDFIICNAVLHFATSHEAFFQHVEKLVSLMSDTAILFIRMTSVIGLESDLSIAKNGQTILPDGSLRYVLTHDLVHEIQLRFHLDFVEPLKTINVNNLRCMSNLILHKKAPDSSEA